jgi:hypothetical protein
MHFLGTERQAASMQVSGVFCRRALAKWLMLLLVPGLVSCSGGKGDLNPVKGTVLYKDTPTGGILVTLHPAKGDESKMQMPTGFTNDDGTFEITTGKDLGAPAGEYTATFIWMVEAPGTKKKAPGTMSMTSEVPMVDKLKRRYSDSKNPAFTGIIITKGANELAPMKLQ